MWYVVQVKSGNEENIVSQCQKIIETDILQKCFISYFKQLKKYNGEWSEEKKILFPGYVFLVSEQIEELCFRLKSINGLTKMIGTGDDIVPLSVEEVEFLKSFGREEQVVEVSYGLIENEEINIIDGPLKGMEGTIKRIDRHKRIAFLEIEMMGRKVETKVGLEIVSKR